MFADSISLTRGDVLTPGSGLLIDHRMQVGWVGADGGGCRLGGGCVLMGRMVGALLNRTSKLQTVLKNSDING